jgi:hypothetical protein
VLFRDTTSVDEPPLGGNGGAQGRISREGDEDPDRESSEDSESSEKIHNKKEDLANIMVV